MTNTDIANMALGFIGDKATITSLFPPDGSVQAQQASRFYPISVGTMLESHDWNFNTQRAYAAVTQLDYFGWRYAYAMPANTAKVISVAPREWYEDWGNLPFGCWPRTPFAWELRENQRFQDFRIEMLGNRQVILSNSCDAVIRFTVSNVQPGNFPFMFTQALGRLLASMLAGALIKGAEGASASETQTKWFEYWSEKAKAADANQQHEENARIPDSIAARMVY